MRASTKLCFIASARKTPVIPPNHVHQQSGEPCQFLDQSVGLICEPVELSDGQIVLVNKNVHTRTTNSLR
jgi:hypothetical protein